MITAEMTEIGELHDIMIAETGDITVDMIDIDITVHIMILTDHPDLLTGQKVKVKFKLLIIIAA